MEGEGVHYVLQFLFDSVVKASVGNVAFNHVVEQLQMWGEDTYRIPERISSPFSSSTVKRRNWVRLTMELSVASNRLNDSLRYSNVHSTPIKSPKASS